jgi:D-lactate dehydrogenase
MNEINICLALEAIFPKERIKCRLIDLVAYAADAGFYYLRPKAVVLPVSEDEIVQLFQFSRTHKVPVVFRAAGTSLSGQSITDGILVDLSHHWTKVSISGAGHEVRVQPGAIGGIVNSLLNKHRRKIGPDPASINSAMMGGILSNNASGMCCGVGKNSYHTTKHIRFILPNGKTYSTELPQDYKRFHIECPDLADELLRLQTQITENTTVFNRIRAKYQTKNTVGYSVNAFIDYNEPLDILAHLLIGGEGTLAFISEAVLLTVPDYPAKSTALVYFTDIFSACEAIVPISSSGAAAIELMDRASLTSIQHMAGVPELIQFLPDSAAALLIEYHSDTNDELDAQLKEFWLTVPKAGMIHLPVFTMSATEQALLWKVRKGMFPAVGAVRASGTTVILEDIAFPVAKLGQAILDLQDLFRTHGYTNAIIFGHAKDGNIHFVVTQDFNTESEVVRYKDFLTDVVHLVIDKYDGALKAEHGTGRNMAPFVETEWGEEIYAVMKAIKRAVDPEDLLNPGVIINPDNHAHVRDLKDLQQVEEEVDRCMECGFCEHKCPSRDVTLTPRKRIVVRRELVRLKNRGQGRDYRKLLDQYQYQGLDTCSVDGLCATACPVDINTGDLVKRLRRENHSATANKIALAAAKNFRYISGAVRIGLSTGSFLNRLLGPNTMHSLTSGIRKVAPSFPLWSNQLVSAPPIPFKEISSAQKEFVYFPACISRVMGDQGNNGKSVMNTMMDLSRKAGLGIFIPENISQQCCGQIYASKGFQSAHAYTVNQTIDYLFVASESGRLAVVLDISSCTQTLSNCRSLLDDENKQKFDKMKIIDSIEYLHDHVLPRLKVTNKKKSIALHPVCSIQKMDGLQTKFSSIAAHFADEVVTPLFAACCGMAGDRGFLHPELTRSALLKESSEVKASHFDGYYSSSKTCEIALSDAVGHNYHSILKLADECSSGW